MYSLRYSPLPWITSMTGHNGEIGASQISESASDCTLLAACFNLLAQELFGNLQQLPSGQRLAQTQHIQKHQCHETGLFLDPLLTKAETLNMRRDWQYMTWQFTFFSLGALDVLNAPAAHPLNFVDNFLEANHVRQWLASREWRNPWLISNYVMFISSFLIREWERTGNSVYGAAVHTIFDWLDEEQNSQTGYWDLGQGASQLNAMAGAFHFYFLYFYLERPVNHIERIIDSTLALQQFDGLFVPEGGGGACLDLDGVDILVKFSMLTDYRADEVKAALTRAFDALLANQNQNGGFCEAKRPVFQTKSRKRRAAELLGLDRLLNRPYLSPPEEVKQYSGWHKMRYKAAESNLWASWFRPLALALISTRYPGEFITDIKWQFRDTPTIGWHDSARLGSYQMPKSLEI